EAVTMFDLVVARTRLAKPVGGWGRAAPGLAGTQRQDDWDSWLWQDRSGGRPACPSLRHDSLRGPGRCSANRRNRGRVSSQTLRPWRVYVHCLARNPPAFVFAIDEP